jgi:S1-C subfamily serine protease
MRVVCSILCLFVIFNGFNPIYARDKGRSCSSSIWEMAKQIQQVKASIVSIHTFYSKGERPISRVGTGFIINKHGYLVTRYNCIREADSMIVCLSDGRESHAWIIHCDPNTEVAVLKIPLEGLTPIAMGQSSDLSQDATLALLGNSLGVFPSLTLVKFSGVESDGMLGLSAMVPPGNCGSPLVNERGESVGVFMGRICRKRRLLSEGVTDIGLPIERVQTLVDSVLNDQHAQGGWIGVSVVDMTKKNLNKGVKVVRLVPGGPADQSNIAVGDVFLEFQGRSILNARELAKWVQNTPPNDRIEILVQKKSELLKKHINVQTMPWKPRKSVFIKP